MSSYFSTLYSQFNEKKKLSRSAGQLIEETLWKVSLLNRKTWTCCIWSKTDFFKEYDLYIQSVSERNDNTCAHVGSCTITPCPNTPDMFVHISMGGHAICISVRWSELNTGRCGGSLSSQPDLCSSSDRITVKCLDPAQVVLNAPVCRFRKEL